MIRCFHRHFSIGGLFSVVSFLIRESVRYVHVARRIIRVPRGLLVDACRRGDCVVEFYFLRTVCERVVDCVANESGIHGLAIKIANGVLRDDQTIQFFVRPLGERGQRCLICHPKVQRQLRR